MENIIEKLYQIHLDADIFSFSFLNKEATEKEWQLYHYLYRNLSGDIKKAFLEYVETKTVRQNEESKKAYVQGFKNALKLITEALKD